MLVWVKISEAAIDSQLNACTKLSRAAIQLILCMCFRVRLLIFGSDFISVFCFSRGSSSYGNCLQLAHKTQTLADRKQETISVQKETEEDKKWPVISHR